MSQPHINQDAAAVNSESCEVVAVRPLSAGRGPEHT